MAILISSIFLLLLFYSFPVIAQSQTNAVIIGSIRDESGQLLSDVNVSLWLNGQIVNVPGNPQIVSRNYSFGPLIPGQYEVRAVMKHFEQFPAARSVNVSNNTVTVDIKLPFYWTQVAPTSPPTLSPTLVTLTLTPTPMPTSKPSNTPAPSPGMIANLLSIGVAFLLICLLKKSH
jgi:hypothetical protein